MERGQMKKIEMFSNRKIENEEISKDENQFILIESFRNLSQSLKEWQPMNAGAKKKILALVTILTFALSATFIEAKSSSKDLTILDEVPSFVSEPDTNIKIDISEPNQIGEPDSNIKIVIPEPTQIGEPDADIKIVIPEPTQKSATKIVETPTVIATAEVELPEWQPLSELDETWMFFATLGEIIVPDEPIVINGIEILAYSDGFSISDGNIATEDRIVDKKLVLAIRENNKNGINFTVIMSSFPNEQTVESGDILHQNIIRFLLGELHFEEGKTVLTRFGYLNDANTQWLITDGHGADLVNAQLGLREFAETGDISKLGINDFLIPLYMNPDG